MLKFPTLAVGMRFCGRCHCGEVAVRTKEAAVIERFLTSLFFPTYEATYTAGYLLPTDDRYREHHDHIWIVLQFVE